MVCFGGLPMIRRWADASRASRWLTSGNHRDPFDRMLIAQAQAENLVLISNKAVFDAYGVRRLW
jgi:PIN domain nuclease of toxin-antitoxin system